MDSNKEEYKPTVSWFLRKSALRKMEGSNGEFYKARIFNGTVLPDGRDISGYTYTFNLDKLKEIKAYETSPDFIKDDKFREENCVIYFNEDTNIKLTEPYDKQNPDKELATIIVDAKTLCTAQRNRNRESVTDNNGKGTKERVTERAISASNSKSDNKEARDIGKEIDI